MSFSTEYRITGTRRIRSTVRESVLGIAVVAALLMIVVSGCSTSQAVGSEDITVTGMVTVRGNVPFHETVLITEDNNWYILDMDAAMRDSLMTPARIRATGPVRLGEWNSRPFTRMTVRSMEILGE